MHRAFNGETEVLDDAIDVMTIELGSAASELTALTLPDGTHPGPTFEYLK